MRYLIPLLLTRENLVIDEVPDVQFCTNRMQACAVRDEDMHGARCRLNLARHSA